MGAVYQSQATNGAVRKQQDSAQSKKDIAYLVQQGKKHKDDINIKDLTLNFRI